jgi:hypothetical protein
MKPLMSQIRLLWRTRRVDGLLGAVLVCSLLLAYAYRNLAVLSRTDNAYAYADAMATYFSVFASMLLHILSAVSVLWAIMVWRAEGPTQRSYHWSLPVDVQQHDLIRVAAGACWMLGVSLFFGVVTFVASHTNLAGNGVSLPPSYWMSFATAVVIPYLFGSAIGLASDRPAEWLLGSYVSLTLVYVMSETRDGRALDPVRAIFDGRLGIIRALSASVPRDPSMSSNYWTRVNHATLQAWGGATLVWLTISAAVFLLSMHRVHRHRFA